MRIGIRIPPCAPIGNLMQTVRVAEHSGLDEVWFPDSQLLWRDVFAVATAAAAATSRITVGTAVTNVVTRHPAVLASAARTAAEAAPGRFSLGVGVGNSAVQPIGLPPATSGELRHRLAIVRDLLAGKPVNFDGVTSRLRDPVKVPVHLAASGPRNLRLAGEIADGALLLSGVSPQLLAAATHRIRAGSAAAERGPVPMTVSAYCHLTDDVPRAARELKPICAGIAQNGGGTALAQAGVHVDVPAQLPEAYPDLMHAEDWDAAIQACDPYIDDAAVTAFARQFCLFGTADEIVDRLKQVRAAGADAVFLQHVGSYDLPHTLLNDVAGQLLPLLRKQPELSPATETPSAFAAAEGTHTGGTP